MASKTKAAKNAGTKKTGPNKSDFIREKLQAGMNPVDIVAAAKGAGITIAPALVYKVKGRSTGKAKPAPKPKSKRGPKPKDGKMSASDFVRSMPASMKAKEIAAAGKAKGIKVSSGLVYMVRSAAKKKGGVAPRRKPGPKPKDWKPQVFQGGNGSSIGEFKKMALGLGIDRARQALDDLERGLAALLG
jgi:hypothetical protein